MLIMTLLAKILQRPFKSKQIIPIQPARPLAPVDVLGQLLQVLGAGELVVVGRADVHERFDGSLAVGDLAADLQVGLQVRGGVEGRVVDCVTVYLADVEVGLYFFHVFRGYAVGYTPDFVGGGGGVRVGEGRPVRAGYEGYDAAWGGGCATVVLAGVGKEVSWVWWLRKGSWAWDVETVGLLG